jgi:hypothetical protein
VCEFPWTLSSKPILKSISKRNCAGLSKIIEKLS